jgi:hypothetical protein
MSAVLVEPSWSTVALLYPRLAQFVDNGDYLSRQQLHALHTERQRLRNPPQKAKPRSAFPKQTTYDRRAIVIR